MASRAYPLRQIIKKRFYPFAEGRQFVREKSRNPLFTTFQRQNGNEVHIFELQWDKYHRPYFVVNFGIADLGAEAHPKSGRLQRRQGGSQRCWFGLRRPWFSKFSAGKWAYTPDEVVTELIDAFDELESWWLDRSEGPHVDVWHS